MNLPPLSDDRQTVWERARLEREAAHRRPSFRRLILNLVVLVLVVATLSFFAAPLVAFYGIRSAAGAGDVQGLSLLINYDAVRASLRPQLVQRPLPQTPSPSILEDPVGAIRRQFEQALPQPVLPGPDSEAYLAPAALSGLTLGYGRSATEVALLAQTRHARPRPVYWSVNRARLGVGEPRIGSQTLFTFERVGPYEWKLVHIRLPDPAASGERLNEPAS